MLAALSTVRLGPRSRNTAKHSMADDMMSKTISSAVYWRAIKPSAGDALGHWLRDEYSACVM
jgi:hypothetical protein